MPVEQSLVEEIRASSRAMARDWGFMGETFAGADLSPSTVHALLEIEAGAIAARDLCTRLRLEKSSLSRLLRKLVETGDILESVDASDSRRKVLSLTPAGMSRVAAIHAHARAQVHHALARLKPSQHRQVREGLRLYSAALAAQVTRPARPPIIELVPGYRPGMIARITQMHALYYARESGFGQRFEAVVAAGLAEFSNRLDRPRNRIWTAMRRTEIVGSIAIDGEDLGSGKAHLRWFIVDDSIRGSGAGRQLLAAALDFADSQNFAETHLWTFSGLAAARHLYESFGFRCVDEQTGSQWGNEVLEQRFVRTRP